MSHALDKFDDSFTYGQYVLWDGGERWELIDGQAHCMSPAPGARHQRLLGLLYTQIESFLSSHKCIAFVAPLDVRLPEADESDEEVATVVQPDLMVFCDRGKIDEKGARGAPDFIIEITSPSSGVHDLQVKARLYETHRVREYWVIDPARMNVRIHLLGEKGWREVTEQDARGRIAVECLPGLLLDFDAVARALL